MACHGVSLRQDKKRICWSEEEEEEEEGEELKAEEEEAIYTGHP